MPYVQGMSRDGQFYLDFKDNDKISGIKLNSSFKHHFVKSIKINVAKDNKIQTLYLDFRHAKKWAGEMGLPESRSKLQTLYQIQAYQSKENKWESPYLSGKKEKGMLKLDSAKPDLPQSQIKQASLIDYLFFRTIKMYVVVGDADKQTLKSFRVSKKSYMAWFQINLKMDPKKLTKQERFRKVYEYSTNIIAKTPDPKNPLERKQSTENGAGTNQSEKQGSSLSGRIDLVKPVRSFSKKGELIPAEAADSECLILDKLDDDPRFFLKTTTPDATGAIPLTCINGEDKKVVYIDSVDFSQRFHLSLDELKEANEKGSLQELIEKKQKKHGYTSQVLEQYARFYDKMSKMKKAPMDTETLMNVVRSAVQNLAASNDQAAVADLQIIKEKGHVVLAGLGKNKKLHLLDASTLTPVTAGSCGLVLKVKKLCSEKFRILKLALDPSLNSAIISEYENGHNYQGPGLQKAANAMFSVSLNEILNLQKKNNYTSEKVYGLMTHNYDGDLESALGLERGGVTNDVLDWALTEKPEVFQSLDEKYEAIFELLSNFDSHHQKRKLHHGDLKLANIFFNRDHNNKIHLIIGDLEAVSELDEKRDFNFLVICMNTTPFGDAQACLEAEKNKDQGLFNQVAHKIDVYALGLVCYEILTRGQAPYAHDLFVDSSPEYLAKYPKDTKLPPPPSAENANKFNEQALIDKGISKPWIEILKGMLDLDYKKRFDINKVKEKLDELYRK